MKRLIVITLVAAGVALWISGCRTDMTLGGGTKTVQQSPTLGQQLVDLQKAKDSGALKDAEFQAQTAKLLGQSASGKPGLKRAARRDSRLPPKTAELPRGKATFPTFLPAHLC